MNNRISRSRWFKRRDWFKNYIDSLLSRFDIVSVAKDLYSLSLKKRGGGRGGVHYYGLCPFHHENTPSFVVFPSSQTFCCYGCGKAGSVIDFVMEYDGLDFHATIAKLCKFTGISPLRRRKSRKSKKQRKRLKK